MAEKEDPGLGNFEHYRDAVKIWIAHGVWQGDKAAEVLRRAEGFVEAARQTLKEQGVTLVLVPGVGYVQKK